MSGIVHNHDEGDACRDCLTSKEWRRQRREHERFNYGFWRRLARRLGFR